MFVCLCMHVRVCSWNHKLCNLYCCFKYTNPLAGELHAPCTQQKSGDVNGCPLLCILFTSDLGDVWFSQHHSARWLKLLFAAKGLNFFSHDLVTLIEYMFIFSCHLALKYFIIHVLIFCFVLSYGEQKSESEFPCRGVAIDMLQNLAVVSVTTYQPLSQQVCHVCKAS